MTSSDQIAVLLMAYGSPRDLTEVAAYYTDIRGGRPPSPEALDELVGRYQKIGGASGLNEATERQVSALAQLLEAKAPGVYKVYPGMKHWHPFIAESVNQITAAGISKVIGLVLAPHYSKKSIGEYESRILKARDTAAAEFELQMVNQWYDQPALVDLIAANVRRGLEGWDASDGKTRVYFTAHSIPAKIIAEGDPYSDQLTASAKLYSQVAGVTDFQIGWQSASSTGEPWVGPDVLELLQDFAGLGGKRVLVAPVGFVSDHLEILYDLDVECVEKAKDLGLEFRRTACPNDDPRFIEALSTVVMGYA